MLDKLLSRFIPKTHSESNEKIDLLLQAIEKFLSEKETYIYSHSRLPFKECEAYTQLKNLPGEEKVGALVRIIEKANHYQRVKKDYRDPAYVKCSIYTNLLDAILRTRFEFPQGFSFLELFNQFYYQTGESKKTIRLIDRPFGSLAMQIEKHVKKHGPQNS